MGPYVYLLQNANNASRKSTARDIDSRRYPGLVTAKSTQFALKCLNDVEVQLRTHTGKEVEESIASRKDDTEKMKKQNTK